MPTSVVYDELAAAPIAERRKTVGERMLIVRGNFDSGIVIGEITDPAECAKIRAQIEAGERNVAWLSEHWADLLPQARGKFVAVAAQEGHIAETGEEAWAWAKAMHPEDEGAIVQYVRLGTGPRIYGNRMKVMQRS
jgi:hypothetical protein